MDELLTAFAGAAGAQYGMTAEQVVSHIAMGDVHHGDATAEECGAVDPRDDKHWCRRPFGHDGRFHCRYRLDEDWQSTQTRERKP